MTPLFVSLLAGLIACAPCPEGAELNSETQECVCGPGLAADTTSGECVVTTQNSSDDTTDTSTNTDSDTQTDTTSDTE